MPVLSILHHRIYAPYPLLNLAVKRRQPQAANIRELYPRLSPRISQLFPVQPLPRNIFALPKWSSSCVMTLLPTLHPASAVNKQRLVDQKYCFEVLQQADSTRLLKGLTVNAIAKDWAFAGRGLHGTCRTYSRYHLTTDLTFIIFHHRDQQWLSTINLREYFLLDWEFSPASLSTLE